MRKIIIIGATSGIGYEVAKIYIQQGWMVGIAGRRTDKLMDLEALAPERIRSLCIDITQPDATELLEQLIHKLGGMDIFFLSSGIGFQNRELDTQKELETVTTNALGFTRMINTAYHFFEKQGKGHIAVISSIAGTKGLGVAPSYSATKRYQNTYIDALAQLSRINKTDIRFTDIRPGFVRTALLKDEKYPLLMEAEKVARIITKKMNQRKRRIIIDWRYRLLVFFWRIIPEWIWERLPIKTK